MLFWLNTGWSAKALTWTEHRKPVILYVTVLDACRHTHTHTHTWIHNNSHTAKDEDGHAHTHKHQYVIEGFLSFSSWMHTYTCIHAHTHTHTRTRTEEGTEKACTANLIPKHEATQLLRQTVTGKQRLISPALKTTATRLQCVGVPLK